MATSSEFLSTKMNIEHEPRHKRQRRWAFYDLTIEMKDFSIFSNIQLQISFFQMSNPTLFQKVMEGSCLRHFG
jgi:hypothetical protein